MVWLALLTVAVLGSVFLYFYQAPKSRSNLDNQGSTLLGEVRPRQDEPRQELGRESSGTYLDPKGRFSFSYPEGFKVNAVPDPDGGEMLTLQNTTKTGEGFQILIQEADEDILITPERIATDIPDIAVNDAQTFTLDGKAHGTIFTSDDPTFDGESREVWFAYKRNVYQVSTYLKYDNLVKEILGTWRF